MKVNLITTLFLAGLLSQSCVKDIPGVDADNSANGAKMAASFVPVNGQVKIAIVSDIHYLSPDLVTNNGFAGEAFQNYAAMDPKLIEYSHPIFMKVMSELQKEKPDLLLIPGDLTKDGEKLSHRDIKGYLTYLESSGMKVYVVPGNHDVNNPEASRYDGNNEYPVDHISFTEFKNYYADFGYGMTDPSIKYRDINSLSYIAEPYKDLWILAIDACRYEENTTSETTAGRIKPATMEWILDKLAIARQQGVTVLGLMHHNLVEHYQMQTVFDPGYVLEDWQQVATKLIDAGLQVIFTGHYHASDITPFYKDGKVLYDVQTGSPVEPPSSYRVVNLKNKDLDISTNRITSINATLPGGMSFVEYSDMFLTEHLDGYFKYLLPLAFGVTSDSLIQYAAPLFRNAVMAHFAGDEKISPDQQRKINLLPEFPPLKLAATSLWTDLGIRDNKVPLKMIRVQ